MSRVRDDSGAALVDFIGLSLLFLVPVTYLVVTLGRIEAATFAAEAAASSSARAAALSVVDARHAGAHDDAAWSRSAQDAQGALALALDDFGFDSADATLALGCVGTCGARGSDVAATVTVSVTLPGVPGLGDGGLLAVTVEASALQAVDSLGR